MTTKELRDKFNNEFGMKEWPKTYEVDHETYANVCQSIFNQIEENQRMYWDVSQLDDNWTEGTVIISLGPNNGIMFKNVELILKNHATNQTT